LYWLAFQRLPIFETDHEGADLRESTEIGGYVIEVGDSFIDADECKRANIPVDPKYLALVEDRTMLSVSHYDEMLKKYPNTDKAFRQEMENEREEARKFENECEAWKLHY
jgi:hypothetical protein